MRRTYMALIALAIVLLLAISALLARVFSADGAERSAVTALVQDEARGDAAAMLARMSGCGADSACRARVVYNAAVLKRPGTVWILQIQSSTGFSLSSTTGYARVAWATASRLPRSSVRPRPPRRQRGQRHPHQTAVADPAPED